MSSKKKIKDSINRVIELKLRTFESTSSLELEFTSLHKINMELFNEIVSWCNETVYTKNGEHDLKPVRKKLYNQYGKKLAWTENQFFTILKSLVSGMISGKSRGYATTFFGGVQSTEKVKSVHDFMEVCIPKKFKIEHAKAIHNSLKEVGFFDRHPFNSNIIENYKDLKFIAIQNVSKSYKSWDNRDKDAAQAYRNIELDLQSKLDKCDPNFRIILGDFSEFCITGNIIKRFDGSFKAWLFDAVLPALEEGKESQPLFYKNKNDKKIRYKLSDEFYDYLKNNPKLWSTDNGKLLYDNYEVLITRDSLSRHHPYARYPFIGAKDFYRTEYFLGNNYSNYALNYSGEKKFDDVSITTNQMGKELEEKYINGSNVDLLGITFGKHHCYSFFINTQKKHYNGTISPHQYFGDFSVHEIESKKSTYLFNMVRHNNSRLCLLKEPTIVRRNNEFHVRLNFTTKFKKTEEQIYRNNLEWYLKSSYCEVKKDKKENRKRLEHIHGKSFNIMGVDLGIRNPYAYVIAKTQITGPRNEMEIIKTGYCEQESKQGFLYFQLLNNMRQFLRFMTFNKYSRDDSEFDDIETFKPLILEAQKYLLNKVRSGNIGPRKSKLWMDFCNKSFEKVISDIVTMVKGKDLEEIKKKSEWVGAFLYKFISYQFSDIVSQRKMFVSNPHTTGNKWDYEIAWIECIDLFKRVKRSMTNIGTGNERIPLVLEKLNTYRRNVSSSYLKILAIDIVRIAHENECKVISLEELLSASNKSKSASARDNMLLALWSPKAIQDAIKNAAEPYFIIIATVDERCTSQVLYETKEFGYRDKGELYFESENGEVKYVDADINASKNIAYRFINKHSDLAQLNIEKLIDKKNNKGKNKDEDGDEGGGKREKGFLTYLETTPEKLIKQFSKEKYIYRNADKWITYSERDDIEINIKDKLGIKLTTKQQKKKDQA